ncbi:MAG TPA: hypothetical protein VE861_15080, partial [Gemmatimonadaceae bacterium]|nr:hypothetical protein [Gemmatimonadaceae bacterium]
RPVVSAGGLDAPPGERRTMLWPMTPAEVHTRAVVRALRRAEDPLTLPELVLATTVDAVTLAGVLEQLLAAGTIVKLLRTRGSQRTVATYALASQLPEPLRAS